MGGWKISGDYPGPFLAGNTLWQVVAHTDLPILQISSELQRIETILVAFDGRSKSCDALQLAETWAKAWGLNLVVVTVQSNKKQVQDVLKQVRQRLEPFNARLVAKEGEPGTVIAELARQHQCNLISLGVSPHHSWRGYSLGGVIDELLNSDPLPLLLNH